MGHRHSLDGEPVHLQHWRLAALIRGVSLEIDLGNMSMRKRHTVTNEQKHIFGRFDDLLRESFGGETK